MQTSNKIHPANSSRTENENPRSYILNIRQSVEIQMTIERYILESLIWLEILISTDSKVRTTQHANALGCQVEMVFLSKETLASVSLFQGYILEKL